MPISCFWGLPEHYWRQLRDLGHSQMLLRSCWDAHGKLLGDPGVFLLLLTSSRALLADLGQNEHKLQFDFKYPI